MSTVADKCIGGLVYNLHEHLATVEAMIEGALTYAELSEADRELLTKAANSVEMADSDLCQISKNH